MHESAEFLASLNHINPERPRFVIKPHALETRLEISFRGQSLELPIAVILCFAARWQADRERQWDESPRKGLRIHPYPLHHTRLDDPDLPQWWVQG